MFEAFFDVAIDELWSFLQKLQWHPTQLNATCWQKMSYSIYIELTVAFMICSTFGSTPCTTLSRPKSGSCRSSCPTTFSAGAKSFLNICSIVFASELANNSIYTHSFDAVFVSFSVLLAYPVFCPGAYPRPWFAAQSLALSRESMWRDTGKRLCPNCPNFLHDVWFEGPCDEPPTSFAKQQQLYYAGCARSSMVSPLERPSCFRFSRRLTPRL